jgi:DNA-binding transcriptional regulator YbjK
MSLNSGSMVEPKSFTIREDVNAVEKLLLEANVVMDDLIGSTPSVSKESEKQLNGSVYQAAYTCNNLKALASNLLARLVELKEKI